LTAITLQSQSWLNIGLHIMIENVLNIFLFLILLFGLLVSAAWKPVVGVAAVACSDVSNSALCRTYEVPGFPYVKVSLKFFCNILFCLISV